MRSDQSRPRKNQRFMCGVVLCVFLQVFLHGVLHAQSSPSAFQDVHSVWVGGECSSFSESFPYQSGKRIAGCGAIAEARWSYHLALDGELRWLAFGGYPDTSEHSYLIGPRYVVGKWGHWEPYGKFLLGDGAIHYPYGIGTDSYFAIAPGGGVHYRLSRRLAVRAEYEYQYWFDSPGFSGEPEHRLHPNGVSVGVSYRLLHY